MNDNYLEWFIDKRILVIVPHQDDEINLAGSFISTIMEYSHGKANIKVVYFTTGNYCGNNYKRFYEAEKALRVLGIYDKRNIVNMGYPEAEYETLDSNQKFVSKSSYQYTYERQGYEEFCYSKSGVHNELTMDNITKDIEKIIIDVSPEVVICNFRDNHPAHILLSNLFDIAIDNLINNGKCYTILRGYCYDTAWTAPRDYYSINIKSTVLRNTASISKEEWNHRLRFPIHLKCRENLMLNNIIAKAIMKHKSQKAIGAAKSIINADCVFWYDIRSVKNLKGFSKLLFEDEFIYDGYLAKGGEKVKYGLYCFDGKEAWIDNSDILQISINNPKIILSKEDRSIYFCKGFKEVLIRIRNSQNGLNDEVLIREYGWMRKDIYILSSLIEQVWIKIYMFLLK